MKWLLIIPSTLFCGIMSMELISYLPLASPQMVQFVVFIMLSGFFASALNIYIMFKHL